MIFEGIILYFLRLFKTLQSFLVGYAAYIVESNVDIFSSSLSVGEFADVFKGLFEDSIVAVKILKVCGCVDYCWSLTCFGFDTN